MTTDRWFVLITGLALIAFIVWFFWLKRAKGVRAAETSSGYQEVMVLVKGGYTPDTILVRAGKPVRINFRREETAGCSDKVIFADFQKSADLPTGELVPVELMPKEPGEYPFACPMGMFRGRQTDKRKRSFLSSRANIVLIGFLAIGGYFLITEHGAHIVPFLPWLLLLACPLMHVFMHGGHGGHHSDDKTSDGASNGRQSFPPQH